MNSKVWGILEWILYQESLKNEAEEFIKHFLIKAFLCEILIRHMETQREDADTRLSYQGMWTRNTSQPQSELFYIPLISHRVFQ